MHRAQSNTPVCVPQPGESVFEEATAVGLHVAQDAEDPGHLLRRGLLVCKDRLVGRKRLFSHLDQSLAVLLELHPVEQTANTRPLLARRRATTRESDRQQQGAGEGRQEPGTL